MNNLELDSRQVINLFSELTSRQQKQVHKTALRKAAGILVRETRNQLRKTIGKAINSKGKWNQSLSSGIRVKADKEGTEAKVHILGDFRLKFFELGTRNRRLRKNRASRGRMKSLHFFRTAKQNKEAEIFRNLDNLISQSIQRIANKNK